MSLMDESVTCHGSVEYSFFKTASTDSMQQQNTGKAVLLEGTPGIANLGKTITQGPVVPADGEGSAFLEETELLDHKIDLGTLMNESAVL